MGADSLLVSHHAELTRFHDGIGADSRDAFLLGSAQAPVPRHVRTVDADPTVGPPAARALGAGGKTVLFHALKLSQLGRQLVFAERESLRRGGAHEQRILFHRGRLTLILLLLLQLAPKGTKLWRAQTGHLHAKPRRLIG